MLKPPIISSSVLSYNTLSPVSNPWEFIVNIFVVVLTPVELNPIGLINNLSFIEWYFTLIAVEVPIPMDLDGLTIKLILSFFCNPWEVETETVDTILSAVAVTWLFCFLNEYLKLSSPSPTKNNPEALPEVSPDPITDRLVTIPIKSLDLLIAYTISSCPILVGLPLPGIPLVDTPIFSNPVLEGSLSIKRSPVLKPWFGRYILWAGIEIDLAIPATVTTIEVERPAVDSLPTDCLGLK